MPTKNPILLILVPYSVSFKLTLREHLRKYFPDFKKKKEKKMKNLGTRRMMKRSVKCSMRSIHSKLPKNQIPCHVELTAGQKLVEDLDVEKDFENEDTNPFQTQIPVKSDVEGTKGQLISKANFEVFILTKN